MLMRPFNTAFRGRSVPFLPALFLIITSLTSCAMVIRASDAETNSSDNYLVTVMMLDHPSQVGAVVDACNRLNLAAVMMFNYCRVPAYPFGHDLVFTCHQLNAGQVSALKREIFKCPGILQVAVEKG